MHKVRCAESSDVNVILNIYAPFVKNTIITFEYTVPALAEYRDRIENTLKAYPFLVCEDTDQIIGFAYADRYKSRTAYDWDTELSIYMAPGYTGKGLGSRLYNTLMEILACQNVVNVYGCLALPNSSSERLHHALGFDCLGKFPNAGYKHGMWVDTVWYGRSIAPCETPAKPFIPFPLLDAKLVAEVLAAF